MRVDCLLNKICKCVHSDKRLVSWILEFDILATSKVIWGWVPTCDRAQSWSPAPMIRYPTQSHYPDSELTRPCHFLLILSTRLGNVKYRFYKSFAWFDQGIEHDLCRAHGNASCIIKLNYFIVQYYIIQVHSLIVWNFRHISILDESTKLVIIKFT